MYPGPCQVIVFAYIFEALYIGHMNLIERLGSFSLPIALALARFHFYFSLLNFV